MPTIDRNSLFNNEGSFYSNRSLRCCNELLCIRQQTEIQTAKSEQSQLFTLDFFAALCSFSLAIYFAIRIFVRHRRIATLENGTKKNLLTTPQYFSTFLTPAYEPVLTLVFTSVSFFTGINLAIRLRFSNPDPVVGATNADFITLAVAATSVLFPLVLLIMESGKDESGISSNPEVMLRRAWTVPVSVVLLTALALAPFADSYYWMRIVVVLSLGVCLFVLARLMHVIFDKNTWHVTEEKILRDRIFDSINEVAVQRAGYNNAYNLLKTLGPHLSSYQLSFDTKDTRELSIEAGAKGRIMAIDFAGLKRIADQMNQSRNEVNKTANAAIPTSEDLGQKKRRSNELIVRVSESELINDKSREIAQIRIRTSLPEQIGSEEHLKKQVRNMFTISPIADDGANSRMHSSFKTLRRSSRRAINNDDSIEVERIVEIYVSILKSVLAAFDRLKIRYNMISAKNEVGLFGHDWKPLSFLFDNVEDLIEKVSLKDAVDREIAEEVRHMPFFFAHYSFTKRELLTFNRSLRLAWHQQRFAKKGVLPARDWLESLADYDIRPALEESLGNSKELDLFRSFIRSFFDCYRQLGRVIIDFGDDDQLSKLKELLTDHPKLYQYEDLDSDLFLQEHTIKTISDPDELEKATLNLEATKRKIEAVATMQEWRFEIVVGLTAYCFLHLENEANRESTNSEKDFLVFIRSLAQMLPTDLQTSLEIIRSAKRRDLDEKWNWSTWEYIPRGEAKFLNFSAMLDKSLALLLLRSAASSDFNVNVSDLGFRTNETYDLRPESNQLAANLERFTDEFARMDLVKVAPEQLVNLKATLKSIIDEADRQAALKLVNAPLSAEKIREFRSDFDTTFESVSKVRKIFSFSPSDQLVEENELTWGVNLITFRDQFIENPDIETLTQASQYGENLASSEEGLVYELLSEKASSSDAKTLTELIQLAHREEVDLTSAIILTRENLWNSSTISAESEFKRNSAGAKSKGKTVFDGTLKYRDIDIPLFSTTTLRKAETKFDFLIVDKNDVAFQWKSFGNNDQSRANGFLIRIVDPKDDSKLADDLVNRDPEWLQKYEPAERKLFVAKMVWLRITQKLILRRPPRVLGMKSVK